MELLTIELFLLHLQPLAGKDLLTPAEASRLQLTITELLVDHAVNFPLLKLLSRYLTQQSYDEIVEERNIEHQCGYLVCDKTPKQSVRRLSNNSNGTIPVLLKDPGASTRFQIYNRKPSMILPNTYLSQYCCKDHYQASIFYRNQLSNEAVFARKDILTTPPFLDNAPMSWYEKSITCLEEVIAKHRELKEHGKSLSDVITMMNGLTVNDQQRDTNELIKLIEDFEIIEKESNLHGNDNNLDEDDDDHDPTEKISRAVDGYITNNQSFGGYVV